MRVIIARLTPVHKSYLKLDTRQTRTFGVIHLLSTTCTHNPQSNIYIYVCVCVCVCVCWNRFRKKNMLPRMGFEPTSPWLLVGYVTTTLARQPCWHALRVIGFPIHPRKQNCPGKLEYMSTLRKMSGYDRICHFDTVSTGLIVFITAPFNL